MCLSGPQERLRRFDLALARNERCASRVGGRQVQVGGA